MVNGNYILYGDRPSSESEIVDDHVHTHTVERKPKRKVNRTANELQYTLNLAQLDNDTDSVKYEKKIKEPRLLRYVPTTDVEENYVSEKFETYDLKPTEERPRRYAFTKKPKNPTDGSINYAYSRSSSSCSSPNGNLPTISEHCEQYGTYRIRTVPSPTTATVGDIITGYETKLDKYFSKPKEMKKFAIKGSHPDSLYRVPAGSGPGAGKLTRILRILRWPVALFAICVALAVFVYFLMPDNMESDMDTVNATYWETATADTYSLSPEKPGHKPPQELNKKKDSQGTKTSEIDFYDADNDKNVDVSSTIETTSPSRKLPIPPIFPSHISPEVQYGNEKADIEKLRSPKLLEATNSLPEDSTLKPHITQKPEKPLAIYLNNGNIVTTGSTETITRSETVNDFTSFDDKLTTKKAEGSPIKTYNRLSTYKEYSAPIHRAPVNYRQTYDEQETPPEDQEFYSQRVPMNVNVNFTSGHSNLFGLSIEDAEKMKSTTQNSLYNTRVSPTLPTWRDGDDSTTKKYPLNLNSEVPQCRSPRLALCRGVLPYDLAGAPVSVGGVDVTTLLPQIEYLVATNCSVRVRHFACSLLEPECNPPLFPPKKPCHNLCKAITDNCDGQIPQELAPIFNCNQYLANNCMSARAPCYPRELPCGDGTCVPRDWICDGNNDCPEGEDEASCAACNQNEHRCASGTCIMKRWLCDGYADCPGGDDEAEDRCDWRGEPGEGRGEPGEGRGEPGEGRGEPGEESAGSAPAPAVRRPSRLTVSSHSSRNLHRIVENDSSKELLMTSDTSNAFKRNFTRRPSLSRLIPYTPRPAPQSVDIKHETDSSPVKKHSTRKLSKAWNDNPVTKPEIDSEEGLNLDDLGFMEEFEKERKQTVHPSKRANQRNSGTSRGLPAAQPSANLDTKVNQLERIIDGAALLKKASEAAKQEEQNASPETNNTNIEKDDDFPTDGGATGTVVKLKNDYKNKHVVAVAACNSGELRCVDGKCITLSQLCDGAIDCSDHADEDNCYT